MCGKRLTNIFVVVFVSLLLGLFSVPSQAKLNIKKKAKLTAAYIYQITKFTEWPAQTFMSDNSSFSLCVLGKTNKQLTGYLKALESKSTHGHKIEIFHHQDPLQLFASPNNQCKVLFATDKQWKTLSMVQIEQLSQTTLLIGSSKRFFKKRGMVALLPIGNKMKIFINSTNIEKTPIRIESRLKALAKAY